jgi:translation initiation factor 2B subunit (eIF-2B alpha/beta/delta family)
MEKFSEKISELVKPIRDDLLSGAAELALRAITIFQTVISDTANEGAAAVKEHLVETSRALIAAQPAMAPLFHLSNTVLLAINNSKTVDDIQKDCQAALDKFEKTLCESASAIADEVFELIPPGELIFAYSFSSTVVSCLLNARARGRYFRVACTEARPSLEGRKLASRLASGGIEVIHTFDNAMSLVLPNCSTAFMGCDCVGRPGVVNKVGSWIMAVGCRELGIPIYALSGTEKFVMDDRLFEFEKHERPGDEVWDGATKGVRVLNHQFDLVPFNLLTGLVTERGILKESDIEQYVSRLEVHEALRLEPAAF